MARFKFWMFSSFLSDAGLMSEKVSVSLDCRQTSPALAMVLQRMQNVYTVYTLWSWCFIFRWTSCPFHSTKAPKHSSSMPPKMKLEFGCIRHHNRSWRHTRHILKCKQQERWIGLVCICRCSNKLYLHIILSLNCSTICTVSVKSGEDLIR